MQKLTEEQVARKRKDKHAKHEAEQKLERKQQKYKKADIADDPITEMWDNRELGCDENYVGIIDET